MVPNLEKNAIIIIIIIIIIIYHKQTKPKICGETIHIYYMTESVNEQDEANPML